jgi:hypothetical protein
LPHKLFGALGGYIHSDLDYDAINRIFSFAVNAGGDVAGVDDVDIAEPGGGIDAVDACL